MHNDRIALELGGVVGYWAQGLETVVVVRFRKANGRLEISEVYLPPTDRPYTDESLRALPLDRITALANEPIDAAIISKMIESRRRPSLESVGARFLAEGSPTLSQGFSAWLPSRPDRRPYPDDFYRDVAHIYRRLVETERNPASHIAAANDVPITTAHRWIREARRRKFLGPATTGRKNAETS